MNDSVCSARATPSLRDSLHRTGTPALALLLAMSLVASAFAQPTVLQEVVLQDHLNRSWSSELIVEPLDMDANARQQLSRAVLLDADGNVTPHQIYVDENRQQHLAFLASVSALESRSYRLVVGADAKPTNVEHPTAGLEVVPAAKVFRLTSGNAGLAIPTQAGDWKAGPVAAMLLHSGQWVGQSQLVGPDQPVRYTVEVTAKGPVFSEVRCEYTFAQGVKWSLRFRQIAGEPITLIREWVEADKDAIPNCTWQLAIAGDQPITEALLRVCYNTSVAPTRKNDLMMWKLDELQQPITLRPWVQWWQGYDGAAINLLSSPKGVWYELEDGGYHVRTGKDKKGPKNAMEREMAELTQVANEMAPTTFADTLLLGAGRAAEWASEERRGSKRAIRIIRAPGTPGEQGGAQLEMQVDPPGRVWFLGSTTFATHHFKGGDLTPAHELVLKHFNRPLDRVRQMTLDWPADTSVARPRLLPSGDRLEQLRADKAEIYDGMPYRKTMKQYLLNPGNEELRDKALAQAKASANGAAGLFLDATRGGANARWAAMTIAPHEVASNMHAAAGAVDIALAGGDLAPEDAGVMRAQLAFAAYTLADENFHSPRLGLTNLPNMTTFAYGSLGAITAVLADHPEAANWTDIVKTEFDRELSNWVGPNGGWLECPHYQTASMEQMLYFGIASQQSGLSDFIYDPRLKAAMLYLAKLSTPRDQRFANRRHFPPIGNTYLLETSNLFAVMAHIYRERDPEYARHMHWVWHEQGKPRNGCVGGDSHIQWIADFLYEEDLEPLAPDWGSELFPATMAVLRSHVHSDRETYLVMHQGPFHSHYDDDQGAFEMWGKGQPLSLDWGYNGRMPAWQHNRVTAGGYGRLKTLVTSDRADALRGEQSGWTRKILLAKDDKPEGPNYFVLRDSLSDKVKGNPDWWLWLYTIDPLILDKGAIRMKGQADVDLAIWTPKAVADQLPRLTGKEVNDIKTADNAPTGLDDLGGDLGGFSLESTKLAPNERTNHIKTVPTTISAFSGTLNRGTQRSGTTQSGLKIDMAPNSPRSSLLTVLYPQLKTEKPVTITGIANDAGVKIESEFGTDYAILADAPTTFTEGDLKITATHALVQQRNDGVWLTLLGPGEITYQGQTLKNDGEDMTPKVLKVEP